MTCQNLFSVCLQYRLWSNSVK